jgi:hypothetical protein
MAHPDDEILWASSVLRRASRILLCYGAVPGQPAMGTGREAVAARYPLPQARFLGLPEPGSFDRALWPDPEETPHGLRLRAAPTRARRYAAAFPRLVETLRPHLTGARDIVTHNPWGEYGHEDHVQVFRAAEALQAELGFQTWVTGYGAAKAAGLMRRHLARLGDPTPPLATDPVLTEALCALYRETGTWTWYQDYAWPAEERFFPLLARDTPAPPGAVRPLHLVAQRFEPQPLWRREALRYLAAARRRIG